MIDENYKYNKRSLVISLLIIKKIQLIEFFIVKKIIKDFVSIKKTFVHQLSH